jgi:hypothetical protein
MTKLNDKQMVVLFQAINNGDIVPAGKFDTRTINSLVKKGFLEVRAGLKGTATAKDYSYDTGEQNGFSDNRRLFATVATHDLFDAENDEEVTRPTAVREVTPKAKKAKKEVIELDVVEEDEDFELADIADIADVEDDEEATPSSVVRETYKKVYAERKAQGGSGQGCADGVDQWMSGTFMSKMGGKGRAALDVQALLAFATDNGIDWSKWAHVNNGMKRMNIAKKVRSLIASGTDIRHGKKVIFKGVKVESQKKAA